jgi:hypothetical protein
MAKRVSKTENDESNNCCVEVRTTDMGKGLFLTRDVAAGQVLLKEPPLLLYVAEESRTNVCAWCFRMTGASGEDLPSR